MTTSKFSQKFLGDSGILRLMDDLGRAVQREDVIMLGGGNPAHIPQIQEAFREAMAHILDSENEFEALIGNYSPPSGNRAFIEALADLLRQDYGWNVSADNIALTNGSQTAFFFLFNMFAGPFPDGSQKKILLPLAPEYIGYADVGIVDELFVAHKPTIEYLEDHLFKYHVDFDSLAMTDDIGAICVSRPTNPTGNVLTEAEIAKLSNLAKRHRVPLIIDNAYGMPFPGIIYTEALPTWEPHVVMCLSLSKLGLPGTRTGIIIADAPVIRAITGMNAILSLAPGSFGAALARSMVQNREIIRLSKEVIRPYYQHKARQTIAWLREELAGTDFYIHKAEGTFFLWLWFRDLPITCQELYERLKARRVVVVPGHYFFPGLAEAWRHRHECIRLNYAGDAARVHAGVKIIAEEVRRAYGASGSAK